jgi:hypothetical protein
MRYITPLFPSTVSSCLKALVRATDCSWCLLELFPGTGPYQGLYPQVSMGPDRSARHLHA